MGLCYREKGWWEEARQSFRRALQMEPVSEEKSQIIQKDLDLLPQEHQPENEEMADPAGEGTGEKWAENPEDDPSEAGRPNSKKQAAREGAWV
jgi:hypothetical protein